MSKKPTLDRREVMAGAAAVAVSAAVPLAVPETIGPSFAAMAKELDQAMTALYAAKDAVVAARPQIYAGMRKSKRKLDAFFAAPEIKARSRARMDARAAAEEILFASATNEAEVALQEKTRELFMTRLGGDILPPSRPYRAA